MFYHATGEYRGAEEDYLEAIETAERVHGQAFVWTFRMRNGLAHVYRSQGDVTKCGRIAEDAIELCKNALGEAHQLTIDFLNNLAWVRESQGGYGEAEALYADALARTRSIAGNSASIRRQLIALGTFLQERGRPSEAEPLFKEALEISRETTGKESVATFEALERLAAVAIAQGAVERGRQFKEELVAALRRRAQLPQAEAGDLNRYAWTLLTCDPVEETCFVQALAASQEADRLTQGKDPKFLDTLALAYWMSGKREEAIATQSKAVDLLPPGESNLRTELEERLASFLQDSQNAELPK